MAAIFTPTGPLQRDLPQLEAQRGGSRNWADTETMHAIRGQVHPRPDSLPGSDREDDFQELRKAALARLKAKARSRAVVLPAGDGGGEEDDGVAVHDAKRLDRATTRRIVDKVLSTKEQEKSQLELLTRMRSRLEAVGLNPPTITIRYKNITATGKVNVSSKDLPNILAPLSARMQPILRSFGSSKTTTSKQVTIIDGASGVLRPGRFTLLLGPPSSGKTTFLRTLAGLARHSREVEVRADELTYNGKTFDEFIPERSAAYISQVDLHYGELTVRETFEFSARVQGTGHKLPLLEELEEREANAGITPDREIDAYMRATALGGKRALITEMVIRLLGLSRAADTVVGNAMMRGISGGEKKRTTTGEVVVGPARAIFADEISTGLDSNTTYQIMQSLKNLTHVMETTVVVGLLQPAPETFDLFDDVILLAAGRVIYHGPREEVLDFFQTLGFECPPRRGVADFLQEVATPTDQEKYWADETRPWRYVTPKMMQLEFLESEQGQNITNSLNTPLQKEDDEVTPTDPNGKRTQNSDALEKAKYGTGGFTLLRAVANRSWILQKRTKVFAIIRTVQVALMALLLASVFWQQSKNTVDDGNYYMAILFFSLLYQLLGGVSEMHLLCDRLPVFFKQRAMRFYPAWTFAVSTFLIRVPFCFIESAIWTNIVYWIVGFTPTVRYLMFWGIIFLINVWSVLFFQLIAAVARDDTIATAFGSFFILIFVNLSGFVIITSDIPGWWQEGFWPNPFSWAMRALAINEFTSSQWNVPDPAAPTRRLGLEVLSFRGFPYDYWWCWAAIGFIIATGILNFVLFVAALTFLKPYKRKVVLSPEELQEIEMSSRTFDPAPTKSVELMPSPRRPSVYRISVESTNNANNEQYHLPPVVEDEEFSQSRRNDSTAGLAVRTPYGPRGDGDVPIPTSVNPINGVYNAGSVDGFGATVYQERDGLQSFSLSGGGTTPRRTSVPASERFSFSSQAAQDYKKRTALPFEPLVMTFRNVEYSVSLPKNADVDPKTINSSGPHAGQLRLLKDISGVFRPHVLTALMGASGAGKTTLMDVLAGRKTGGVITGDIRVNGHPKQDKTFSHVSGYVEQTDVHLPQSSVREALEFSSALRLPTTVDANTRARFVSEILELVELDKIQGAYVGVPGVSGLSVEQRKRLTLAVELVANPSIIFMDEPTSGLDARAASIVMTAIRNTVNSGRTVTCTIHQPSVDIFESFDELLLLKPGGRTVYFGPLGDNAERLIDYLQGLPGVEPIKPRYNPANWMLETLGKEGSLSIDFAEAYKQSEVANEMEQVIAKAEVSASGSKPMVIEELHLPPWKLQFSENLKRFNRMYWRSPEYNLTRALVTLLIAFAFGTLFWRQGQQNSTAGGVLNIAGVLFSSVLFMGITNCLTVQHIVALQRSIMYRERAAGYYGVVPFALAQQVVELPYLLVQAIIYSMIVYWCVYFAVDAGKFFWFVLFFLLTLIYFVIFGMMAVALTPAVALANVFCSLWFGIMNLYSGFIKPEPAMPVYWRYWVPWANPVAWSIYGLSVSQLGNVNDVYVVNFTGQTVTVSEFLAQRFNWHYYMVGPIVAILVGFTALFSIITVLSLKFINYQRR